MTRQVAANFAMILCALFWGVAAGAESRHAMVIGNSAYRHATPLANPVNDARAVGEVLEVGGWKTSVVSDATARRMRAALREFGEAAGGAEAATFFYAGHGIEVNGENYLLPIDAKLDSRDDLAAEAIGLEEVMKCLRNAGVRLKIVVLDACRDNPLPTRSWLRTRGGRGLVAVAPDALPEGTLLVFSTEPGKAAPDGIGEHSPFTAALLQEMQAGGSAMDVFMRTAGRLTDSVPWLKCDESGKTWLAFHSFAFNSTRDGAPGDSDFSKPGVAAVMARGAGARVTKRGPFGKVGPELTQWVAWLAAIAGIGVAAFFLARLMRTRRPVPQGATAGGRRSGAPTVARVMHGAEETAPVVARPPPRRVGPAVGAGDLPGKQAGDELTNGLEMVFCWCPPGEFLMGSPKGEEGRGRDELRHRVMLTEGFWVGKFPVGQGQYEKLVGKNPSHFRVGDSRLPVESVTWEEADFFCRHMTVTELDADRLPPGWEYRLPTEAQWEYACRAGTESPFGIGDGCALSSDQANFDGNHPYGQGKKGEHRRQTMPPGTFDPNRWGLHDMHGNVWEWCQDWYGEYPADAATDPRGPAEGSFRVYRGGGWRNDARYCRSARRNWAAPATRSNDAGFRVALVAVGKGPA